MRVYLDTGVFIDYLINRSHAGHYLRKGARRGRTPRKLNKDVVSCLSKIRRKHEGFTSCLALYELEHALVTELKNVYKGSSHLNSFIIASARPAVVQGMRVTQIYNIKLLDLTENIVLKQVHEVSLQFHGIMAADSLHVVTAIQANADMIISTDTHIQKLDNLLRNSRGSQIRCVDTDVALSLL
jgi:predicted nucleic acid-binding protein